MAFLYLNISTWSWKVFNPGGSIRMSFYDDVQEICQLNEISNHFNSPHPTQKIKKMDELGFFYDDFPSICQLHEISNTESIFGQELIQNNFIADPSTHLFFGALFFAYSTDVKLRKRLLAASLMLLWFFVEHSRRSFINPRSR